MGDSAFAGCGRSSYFARYLEVFAYDASDNEDDIAGNGATTSA